MGRIDSLKFVDWAIMNQAENGANQIKQQSKYFYIFTIKSPNFCLKQILPICITNLLRLLCFSSVKIAKHSK